MELRIIGLDGRGERRLATLSRRPKDYCARAEGMPLVRIQMDDGFVVDERKNAVCIELMDRNLNMADVEIRIRIDVKSGKTIELVRPSPCRPPNAEFLCPIDIPPTPKIALPFFIQDQSVDAVSESGRFLVVSGNLESADYIHRQAVVFDKQRGDVFLVGQHGLVGPLAPDSTRHLSRDELCRLGARDIVGETTVRWIGERLLVGTRLMTPGGGSFDFGGGIAR